MRLSNYAEPLWSRTEMSRDLRSVQLSMSNVTHVVSKKDLRSVLTKPRLLSRIPPRSSVLLSPSVPASMWPTLYRSWPLLRSVLMSPWRFAPGQEQTQGRSRSQLSRNGVMCHQRNLDWPKSRNIGWQWILNPAWNSAISDTSTANQSKLKRKWYDLA